MPGSRRAIHSVSCAEFSATVLGMGSRIVARRQAGEKQGPQLIAIVSPADAMVRKSDGLGCRPRPRNSRANLCPDSPRHLESGAP